MDRKETIKSLWTKGFFGWRLEKQQSLHNGKEMYYALPPKDDERNRWASLWEPIPYYDNRTNELLYYVFYPHWFEEEFSKDMQKIHK